jgi:lysyl-tRNA synthetase class 2
MGDFISAEGVLFETNRGEKTLEVTQWAMLGKSLLPLPEKWHGLQDVEERFRKRYLDLIMNEEVRERFRMRSAIITCIRKFHEKNGFLEVETPTFHAIPGGTLAKPFVTHHNALHVDLYLRIAPELYLKRLLVGGFERIYEIGKSFRNEGIDATHNPEFTMLECYAAYWDEEDMMAFVEDLFCSLVKEFFKGSKIEHDGKQIIFKKPFARITFKDLLARYALIPDYEAETRDSLAMRARQLGVEAPPHESKGKIADEIYKKICRPYLVQPTFLVHHPADISPLSKKWEDHPSEVRRFQLVANGLELTNAFAELNDPIDQRERFEEQEHGREGGDEEAHRFDEEFIEALEHGMPPAAGLGIGIDRLIMFLTNQKNIREVVLFPTMRPK